MESVFTERHISYAYKYSYGCRDEWLKTSLADFGCVLVLLGSLNPQRIGKEYLYNGTTGWTFTYNETDQSAVIEAGKFTNVRAVAVSRSQSYVAQGSAIYASSPDGTFATKLQGQLPGGAWNDVKLVASRHLSAAIIDGKLYTWSDFTCSILGRTCNETAPAGQPAEVSIPAVKHVALSYWGGIAITQHGDVYSFGNNDTATWPNRVQPDAAVPARMNDRFPKIPEEWVKEAADKGLLDPDLGLPEHKDWSPRFQSVAITDQNIIFLAGTPPPPDCPLFPCSPDTRASPVCVRCQGCMDSPLWVKLISLLAALEASC